MKKTRAKGNDVITNVISLRQSAFRIDFFDANIKLASLPFPLPRQRRPGELARRLKTVSRTQILANSASRRVALKSRIPSRHFSFFRIAHFGQTVVPENILTDPGQTCTLKST